MVINNKGNLHKCCMHPHTSIARQQGTVTIKIAITNIMTILFIYSKYSLWMLVTIIIIIIIN